MKPLSIRIPLAPLALAAALVGASVPARAVVAAEVGEVTLTIGQAMNIPASGVPVALQRGSKIHPGDRIETADGGHVDIRFVDGAMVSVRPTSRWRNTSSIRRRSRSLP